MKPLTAADSSLFSTRWQPGSPWKSKTLRTVDINTFCQHFIYSTGQAIFFCLVLSNLSSEPDQDNKKDLKDVFKTLQMFDRCHQELCELPSNEASKQDDEQDPEARIVALPAPRHLVRQSQFWKTCRSDFYNIYLSLNFPAGRESGL